MSDDGLSVTSERRAEIIDALDIPQALRDALKADPYAASDGLVHWRGLNSQSVFTFLGLHQPTRCGRFEATATLGWPLKHVTCPKCRELAEADDA